MNRNASLDSLNLSDEAIYLIKAALWCWSDIPGAPERPRLNKYVSISISAVEARRLYERVSQNYLLSKESWKQVRTLTELAFASNDFGFAADVPLIAGISDEQCLDSLDEIRESLP